MMSLSAGTKLARYEIRSKIGEGGTGEMYRARDEKLNRDVAIKVLPATLSENADRLNRFEQEAHCSLGNTQAQAELAHAYAVSGKKEQALKMIAELQEQAKTKYVSPYQVGVIYAGLGDSDQAFAWLEKAYEERSVWLVNLNRDQRLDGLRSDPRFSELVRRMGLPQ